MPKSFKLGMVGLCDAVYKDEQSNKAILAGLYSGNILVEAFPSDLRFGLYMDLYLFDTSSHDLDMKFYAQGKYISGAKSQISTERPSDPVTVIIPIIKIASSDPASFELRISVDGSKPIVALEKQILSKSSASTA